MLFAGVDKNGPQLYHMDPSGTYLQFGAKAIGSGSEGAQQSLQELYHKVIAINCNLFFFLIKEGLRNMTVWPILGHIHLTKISFQTELSIISVFMNVINILNTIQKYWTDRFI